jgi:hypothetical protein
MSFWKVTRVLDADGCAAAIDPPVTIAVKRRNQRENTRLYAFGVILLARFYQSKYKITGA